MKIGLAGLGKMGTAMGLRLIDQGHALTVWNRTPGRAGALVGKGAKEVKTPAGLAAGNDVVITMVFDDAAVEEVYTGREGVLSADVAGRVLVDMSTVRPQTARKVAAAAKAKGAGFLDAPVGGSVNPAREGKLLVLVGGEAADFAKAKPVLEALGRRVEHCGPSGAGTLMKLAVNLPLMVYWEALGEAMALGEAAGLDPARTLDILRDTSGTNRVMEQRIPAILKGIANEPLPAPTFSVAGIAKDSELMVEVLRDLGADAPVIAATAGAYSACAADGDWAGRDGTAAVVWRFLRNRKR